MNGMTESSWRTALNPRIAWLREQVDGQEQEMLGSVERESKRRILEWCWRLDPGDGLGGLMASEVRKVESWLAMPYADSEGYADLWPYGPYVER
jgi:hypothetical protein